MNVQAGPSPAAARRSGRRQTGPRNGAGSRRRPGAPAAPLCPPPPCAPAGSSAACRGGVRRYDQPGCFTGGPVMCLGILTRHGRGTVSDGSRRICKRAVPPRATAPVVWALEASQACSLRSSCFATGTAAGARPVRALRTSVEQKGCPARLSRCGARTCGRPVRTVRAAAASAGDRHLQGATGTGCTTSHGDRPGGSARMRDAH